MNTIAVYRDHILPFPETFISNQALGLQSHRAILVGLERKPSPIELPEDRIFVSGRGKFGRLIGEMVRRFGWLPPRWIHAIADAHPTLIHAHYAVDACHALPIAQRLQIPLIVTCHGYDVAQDEGRISNPSPTYRRYMKRRPMLWEYAQHFIAVSHYIRECMIKKGFPAEKISVIPIGINTQVFDGQGDCADATTVLFVGRVDPDKGIFDLLAAMEQVHANFPQAKLEVIGGGSQLNEAKRRASTLPFDVVFRGPCAQSEVKQRLRSCGMLCVPSRTGATGAQEALGLVFGEAQAMQVPVVTYRIGGIPEIVHHGVTGLVVTEGNIAELSNAITTILSDKSLRDRMGKAGRERVIELYDSAKCLKQLEALYDSVSESPRSDAHETSISISQIK
jgi:colanic acid/amylovoran biosynthesis glycosyltransferase